MSPAKRPTSNRYGVDRRSEGRTSLAKISVGALAFTLSVAAASLAAAATAADPAAPYVWQPGTDLAAGTDSAGHPAGGYSSAVSVTTVGSPDRDVTYATFIDSRADDRFGQRNQEVELRTSNDDGRTWGPLIDLSNSPTLNEWAATSASDGQSVLVAAPTQTPAGVTWTTDAIHFMRVNPDGTVARKLLASDMYYVNLAGDDGTYYLIGEALGMAGPAVFLKSTDGGQTWTDPVSLAARPADGCINGGAHIAADNDTVVATWTAKDCGGSGGDIKARVSHDAGATWGPAIKLTSTPQNEGEPSVAASGNSVVVAWTTPRSSTSTTVDVTRSTDAGASWATPTTVDDLGSLQQYSYSNPAPTLRSGGGRFVLFPMFASDIFVSDDLGATWSADATVPPPVQSSSGYTESVSTVSATSDGYLAFAPLPARAFRGAPMQAPAAVENLSVTPDGPARSARVTWSAPTNAAEAPVESYNVTADPAGSTEHASRQVTVPGSATSATVPDLELGVEYTFSVVAQNQAGHSDPATAGTATLTDVPAKPATPTVTVNGSTITVRWKPPTSDGGTAVTGYVVRIGSRTFTVAAGKRSYKVKKLPAGKYKVSLQARNAVGVSAMSVKVTVQVKAKH